MADNSSLMVFLAVVWNVFSLVFPIIVLGLLISIHLRLKDIQRLQSEVFREVAKQGRTVKASAPDPAEAHPPIV